MPHTLLTERIYMCECCGAAVRLMCEDRYCSSRCRRGKCGHVRDNLHGLGAVIDQDVVDAMPPGRAKRRAQAYLDRGAATRLGEASIQAMERQSGRMPGGIPRAWF